MDLAKVDEKKQIGLKVKLKSKSEEKVILQKNCF